MNAKTIIDPLHDLMKLSDEELNEVLLDNKYNKANLRELSRRAIKLAKKYEDALLAEGSRNNSEREMAKVYEQMFVKYKNISSLDEHSSKYLFEMWKMMKELYKNQYV